MLISTLVPASHGRMSVAEGSDVTKRTLLVNAMGLGALEPQRYGHIGALVRVGFSLDG